MKWHGTDPTDVEVWYPPLKNFTFKTNFISLPFDAAQALLKLHELKDIDKVDKNNVCSFEIITH